MKCCTSSWNSRTASWRSSGAIPPDQAEIDKAIAERRRRLETIRQAVMGEDAAAQWELADCYVFGRGVKIDGEQAFYWLRKAAGNGLAEAQFSVGRCYSGRPDLDAEEVTWLRKAAATVNTKRRALTGEPKQRATLTRRKRKR